MLLPVAAPAQSTGGTLILKPVTPLTPMAAEALAADHRIHVARVSLLRRSGKALLVELSPGADRTEAIAALRDDPRGHGTMVAGIIAAKAGDGFGMAGVCAPCRILPVRITAGDSFEVAVLIDAIDQVIKYRPQVINISAGLEPGLKVSALRDVVRDAVAAGITVVVAAGNDGGDVLGEPAAYPETIAVGAIARTGHRTTFSSRGEQLDLSAPGVDILSSVPADLGAGDHSSGSGTSYAVPFVAGVAGLMKAAEPDLMPIAAMIRPPWAS